MGYQLGIDTLNNIPHPSFRYESMDEAIAAAADAIDSRHYEVKDQGIVITTGPGTIYKMVSEEHLQLQDSSVASFSWVLMVQIAPDAALSFGFNNEADMAAGVIDAHEKDVFHHCAKIGHEYTFIHNVRGFVYMKMTKSQFLDRQHAQAVAMQQQKAAQDAKTPRILHPR